MVALHVAPRRALLTRVATESLSGKPDGRFKGALAARYECRFQPDALIVSRERPVGGW